MKTWDSVQSVDGRGEYSSQDLKNIPPLEVPGVYKLTIVSASHRAIEVKKPESKHFGEILHKIGLRCVARNRQGDLVGTCDLDLLDISFHVNNLCFFLNIKNKEGQLYLPDYETVKYTDKATGESKTFEKYSCFENGEVWGAVDIDEPYITPAGMVYRKWKLIAFVDAQGFTARDIVVNDRTRRSEEVEKFLQMIKTIAPAKPIDENAIGDNANSQRNGTVGMYARPSTTSQNPYGSQPQSIDQVQGVVAQAFDKFKQGQGTATNPDNQEDLNDPLPF